MSDFKNNMQLKVEEFMQACGQDVWNDPCVPTKDIARLRIKLMIEEMLGTTKKPEGSLVPSTSDELVQSMLDENVVGIADGLADLLYVVFGTAAAYGINIQAVFDEVHRSNMTKVVDGVVIRREDGKILKPDTYSPADVKRVVRELGGNV